MKKNLIFIATFMAFQLSAAPLGLLQPYDFMIEPERAVHQAKLQCIVGGEYGIDARGFNGDGKQVNSMQIYEEKQNILGLFQGLGTTSEFNNKVNMLAAGPGGGVNNDQNGMFSPTGTLTASQIFIAGKYTILPDFYAEMYVPFYTVKLDNIDWKYAGNNVTFADKAIQKTLVDTFHADALKFFNLNTQGWQYTGIGDVTGMLHFKRNFPQGRQVLRNVQVHARMGLTLPTGKQANENDILSIPLGNDGSISTPFAAGLDVNLGRYCQVGLRANFEYFWGNEKKRRVKTFGRQTTLLYPEVVDTFKDYGFVQHFDLYAMAYNVANGLSLRIAYEYMRKSSDVISVQKNGYDYELINTSKDLDEVTRHEFIIALLYDSGFVYEHSKFHPQVSMFAKLPFNGSYTHLATSVGLQFSCDW